MKKMNIYIYLGRGYSYGGWGGYCNVVVAEGFEAKPSWRNKEMNILEEVGLCYEGRTKRSELSRELERIKEEYPSAIFA